jgi:hypothetical protein
LRHVEETDSGAPGRVLPGNLSRQADAFTLTGKREFEINLGGGRERVGGLERGSSVAEIGENRVDFRGTGIGNAGGRVQSRARRATAFAA